ncbi:hypothetical protein WA158_003150 [Blastocystis sp. Blastoise]
MSEEQTKTQGSSSPTIDITIQEEKKEEKKTGYCYEEQTNCLTWPMVSFLTKMIVKGWKKPLQGEDLGEPSMRDDPSVLFERFEEHYVHESEKPKEKRGIFGSIVKATGFGRWFWSLFGFVITIFLTFVPTLILQQLVSDLEYEGEGVYLDDATRWGYCVLLLVVPVISAYITALCNMIMARIGVQMKSMASEAIYRKALNLTSTAKGNTSTGQLVNIMSSDTNMLQMFSMFLLITVSAPVFIIVAIVLIANMIGWLTWIALGIFVLMMLCQLFISGFARKFRMKTMQYADERIKLLNEVLMGIRVIKYYCWERPFLGKVDEIREKELVQVRNMHWLMTIGIEIILQIVPYMVPFVIFAMYPSSMGQALTPSTIFTLLSLFEILRVPFMMLPMCIMMLIQFNVSLKRINNFLSLDEVDDSLVIRNLLKESTIEYVDEQGNKQIVKDYNSNEDAILVEEGSFAWGAGDNVLKNINLKVKKGSLVAVVGRVGSGKTSFVSALIGEMTKNSGCCILNGSVSFASQQAWMVNDTVRGNVLFGKEFEEERYKRALHVCCMEDDLKVLKGGEMCEIGERGINLSGGQKARIGLARCVYSDTDIVIMDDPIAAVDAHVGKYLFNKCIKTELNGKTRILVTNALQYLPKCDYIVLLGDNTIEAQGTWEELKAMNINILEEIEGHGNRSSEVTSRRGSTHTNDTKGKEDNKENDDKKNNSEGGLVEKEEQESGSIPFSIYNYYFKRFSWALIIIMLLCFTFGQILTVYSNFWLSDWSADSICKNGTSTTIIDGVSTVIISEECQASTNNYLSIYGYILIGICVFYIIRACCTVPGRIRASFRIHKDLATVIVSAPVAFHDITPIGRVLNRFNKDMDMIDNQLAQTLLQVLMQFFVVVGYIVQISITTTGIMIPLLAVIIVIFYFLQSFFRRANTDVQRLESISRSPIFEDFQAVLSGAPTIRAYGHQERFIKKIENRILINNHRQLIFQYCSCWLTLRTDILVAFVAFFVVIISNSLKGLITAGLLGIALNASYGLGATLKQWTRVMAQLEAQMNSVERVKYYIDTVEPESNMILEDHRPPENWPTEGAIKFDNFEMRYRNGPKVLKGVNMDIHPMEKVGVVGRTGAGKSSLMVGLFRISECCGGAIYMDNIKLEDIGLEDVRRHLCIIPQDPVLFSASVRFNLDPFNESSDEEIWRVLEEVELKEAIDALPGKLDGDVHEGGSNFSVGQRQLICMARALLKRPKVLIMDEATASLDNETDGFLQTMIRKQFINCTVLTIAHRLNTIMDSDRVCVMDQGIVAEFDTPLNLLNNPNSIFSGMVVAANDPNLYTMVKGYTGPIPQTQTVINNNNNNNNGDNNNNDNNGNNNEDNNSNNNNNNTPNEDDTPTPIPEENHPHSNDL